METLTLSQIQKGIYPICPVEHQKIHIMDYDELKNFCLWKAQTTILTEHKRYLALCQRANINNASGMTTLADWRKEHAQIHTKFCIQENEIESEEYRRQCIFMKSYTEQRRDLNIRSKNLDPILITKFDKNLKRVRVYSYNFPAHWKTCGYNAEFWELREAKKKIVDWYKSRVQ